MKKIRVISSFEPDEEQKAALHKAKVLEWLTLAALATIIALMAWAMGGSQSMKTAWIEDMLSLIPPSAYLLSSHFRQKPPNVKFPFGYHRATLIAFLTAAVALTGVGILTLLDAILTLIHQEHPSVGGREIMGRFIWSGWIMIAVLIYSAILPVILGHLKHKVAHKLHDKTLLTDAAINRADWMTAVAGCLGVLGIGVGWWWADAVAAAVISLDIIADGWKHLNGAVSDLMDRTPTKVDDESQHHPLVEKMIGDLKDLEGCEEAQVRLRDFGLYLTGAAFLTASRHTDHTALYQRASELLTDYDPELHDCLVVVRPGE